MSDSPQEDKQAKRTRVEEEDKEEVASREGEKKEEEKKTVPSWLSAQTSAPAWASASSASAAHSWLVPSTSSFGGAASAAPSWLTSSSTSSAFGAESSNAFGALSSAASVFGAKKPDEGGEEEDGEDDKSSTGEGGEDEEAATFGHGAEEDQIPLATAAETGEEHEVILCQHRVKLYQLSKGDETTLPSWVEVGFGPLRLNAPINTQDDSLVSRLVMRRQGVWTLLLNSPVNSAFTHQVVGDKMLRMACEHFDGTESAVHTYLVKFARQDDRDEFTSKLQDVLVVTHKEESYAKKTGLVEA
ncbi:hypothetical protein BASA81_001874 [Batrachochytrium salamandrivorans]|nr:hypothetical protein BASA81_001874 [Batrachochytrium salamandrivorans]